MDARVRTALPLITWVQQKLFGPVLTRDEWRAVARSLVPPPDTLVTTITRGYANSDDSALHSASERRRFRGRFKHRVQREPRDTPMQSAVRDQFLKWRREFEAAGYSSDPTRLRNLKDMESETNDDYARLCESPDLAKALAPISPVRAEEAVALCWEFAQYAEGGSEPKLRRNSGIWKALGFDPDRLRGMTAEDGVIVLLTRFRGLLGLGGKPPEETNLLRVARWVVRTHLPPDKEPETTPRALHKAVVAGLIYRGIEKRDSETGDVVEQEVEDLGATRFIQQAEAREELERIVSHVRLSPGERLVFAGMRKGFEGEDLAEWVEAQGQRVGKASVPVLRSRVLTKMRVAAKS